MYLPMRGLAHHLALACFLTACTGLEQALHLHASDHDSKPDDCQICYQLTVGTPAVVDVAPAVVNALEAPAPTRRIVTEAAAAGFEHQPFAPRAPPTSDLP